MQTFHVFVMHLLSWYITFNILHVVIHTSFAQSSTAFLAISPQPVMLRTCSCLHFCELMFLAAFQHHCRKCGVVCCGACSLHRWLLPQQSTLPLRVCTLCYNKLASPAQQTGVSEYFSLLSWVSG